VTGGYRRLFPKIQEPKVSAALVLCRRQGRGIGRAALRQACEQLRADGARRIGLDVDVANDRALGLYTSIGSTPVTTEDYFALPLS
jgi:ribosomal protein S18 acetylase RimI-like enzyme